MAIRPEKVTLTLDASSFVSAMKRVVEATRELGAPRRRQERLTRALGQVTCSTDPAAHDVENLPCRWCEAAL